ncbi:MULTISPECIES: conjugated bile salt MFS transporter [unclassified Romboutsia]|uniref:conjugated bile salt MFS transporter n=1 Tax=unclassified Romboutsia TaxID=2626894 RepID=UPI000822A016|nr:MULTISPECIES: conjugated bile salt MFS transporter [unclassified Romboutsia]SCI33014.1 Oxalate:formate exchange protein [uncultured Clostridium sp.]
MNASNNKKENQFFYGWIIVIACLLIQIIPFGVGANLPPAFTNYVVKGEGFSFAAFSLIFTIGTIASAICSPFIGKLFTKVNAKVLYIVGSILLGGGFMLYSFAGNNLFAYYAIAALVQVGLAIVSAIGVPTLINSWFKVNKGLAMGIAFSGGGIGNIFLQVLAGKWLSDPNIGYRGAYLRFGMIALITSLLISIFLIRMPKSDAELAANIPKKKKGEEHAINHIPWGYKVSEVTKMAQFWIIGISFIFVGFYVSGMVLQFIAFFQNLEASGQLRMPAAMIASLFGFFSIFGNLFGGVLFDKLGLSKSFGLAGILVVTCGICLIFVPNINELAYIFAAGLGISMFSYIMGPSYMTGVLFGDRDYGTILGLIQVFFALGFAIGSPIFGIILDRFGWNAGWISTIVYAIIAYIGLISACSTILRVNKENNVTETKRIS